MNLLTWLEMYRSLGAKPGKGYVSAQGIFVCHYNECKNVLPDIKFNVVCVFINTMWLSLNNKRDFHICKRFFYWNYIPKLFWYEKGQTFYWMSCSEGKQISFAYENLLLTQAKIILIWQETGL